MMKKYSVSTQGFEGSVVMTAAELRAYVQDDTKKARRYFGTAVCHTEKDGANGIYFTITARRDIKSALWGRITARNL